MSAPSEGAEGMTRPAEPHRHRASLVSAVPGRIRVRLARHGKSRDPGVMDAIRSRLAQREGLNAVRVNPANGSVTIDYDHHRHSLSGLLGLLEDVDIAIDSVGKMARFKLDEEAGPEQSGSFIAAVEALNRSLRSATGLPIDLKTLLPLSFAGAGLWSILRSGLMIEKIPGWILLWLAFDIFVKLHPIERKTGKD